jgi:uncharacterized protein YbjT (DUF2867 family)
MKIAVFGASGLTGQEVVKQALARGHQIQVLARTPSKIAMKNDNLSVIAGDVLNADAVKKTIAGTAAVVVCLGGKTGDQMRVLAPGTQHVVSAMKGFNIKRLVAVTSMGVGDSKGQAGFFFDSIIVPIFLRAEFKDKEAQEEVIRKSDLDYVIVRPGGLTNKAAKHTFAAVTKLEKNMVPRISRADVAAFCLDQLLADEWIRRSVSLCDYR